MLSHILTRQKKKKKKKKRRKKKIKKEEKKPCPFFIRKNTIRTKSFKTFTNIYLHTFIYITFYI